MLEPDGVPLPGEEDMGGSLTKLKAPTSSHGKKKKKTTTAPGPVPPLPYLEPGSAARFGQEDYDAIYGYTNNIGSEMYPGYKIINPYLRNPDSYPPEAAAAIQERSDRVSAAMAKLPPQPGMTYRGDNLFDDLLENYGQGTAVTERAFTSTSADPAVATENFQGNVVMMIGGQRGRDISGFSRYPKEKEVLYDKGTRFNVVAKAKDPESNKWFILLGENES